MIRHKLFILLICFSCCLFANTSLGDPAQDDSKFNPGEMIMHHIIDSHDWHLFDWKGHAVSIPLPIIIYHEDRGLSVFLSSRFNHGYDTYMGYKLDHGRIICVNNNGTKNIAETSKIWDFSITKNTFSLFLSIIVLLIVFIKTAHVYKTKNSNTPKGLRGFLEIMII